MNSLKYKGFVGSIGFNESDGIFSGKIEGVDGVVRFEGSSIKELTDSFHKAVDDYLQQCARDGVTPRKSYTGTLNIRISPSTHSSIADYAAEAGISINSFIKRALEKAVENPEAVMNPLADGYPESSTRASTLEEQPTSYHTPSPQGKDIAEFWIPSSDIGLAKTLAARMGWEFLANFPETGLEMALDDIREGRVKEYGSVKDFMKDIEEGGDAEI